MEWFWYFLLYSFWGYLLEKLFAALSRSPHRVRKCRLVLPLCPVYGLAMTAVLLLPQDMTDTFWKLWLYGALIVTAVEFAVHLFYDKVLGVAFWDYSATKMDVDGRICMPFSIAWGFLVVLAVRGIQPWLTVLAPQIPPVWAWIMLGILVADTFFSLRILLHSRDIDLMSLPRLIQWLQQT
ncbi:MAG: hypothetical protein E7446_00155 [Ruminococcaceae bacterium]|nr:hypothetical protein [Oscillospiraceae bacterium]